MEADAHNVLLHAPVLKATINVPDNQVVEYCILCNEFYSLIYCKIRFYIVLDGCETCRGGRFMLFM